MCCSWCTFSPADPNKPTQGPKGPALTQQGAGEPVPSASAHFLRKACSLTVTLSGQPRQSVHPIQLTNLPR